MYRQRQILCFERLTLSEVQLQNYALFEIEHILQKNNKSLNDYPPLPTPNHLLLKELGNRLMREELAYDTDKMLLEHQELHKELNNEQKRVYNVVLDSVHEDKGGLFFVYGAGGTGKTYLYKTIIARLRGEGKIVLAVASSSIAALLLPSGRTAHFRFKIPIDISDQSTCDIHQGTQLAELICKSSLII